RLPTLSASQALSAQQLQKAEVSTGSCTLNSILGDGPSIPKGKLTEVCGPPGSGKTTFGIQVAANALLTGEKVTWIETAQPLPISRLIHLLEHQSDKDPFATLNSLRIIQCPTLAHLLALILYPPPPTATYCFPEKDTGVLVIDNISTPFSIAFPPGVDAHVLAKKGGKGTGASDGKAQVPSSVRRFSIMTDLAVGLGKLAAIKNIVILVLNQLTTRIIPGVGAVLQPAVGSPNWSNAFMNRLLIYRHDVPSHKLKFPEKAKSVRYVSILKASNVSYENGDGPIVSITVGDHGIGDVE
ncbi:P-loop containing nucleoside triphosphate hydrolase protein, partial [Kalaharituber pfeilii]